MLRGASMAIQPRRSVLRVANAKNVDFMVPEQR